MPVTIDGTTGIQIPDGTAANPAIRGTTSANTGLFFPAANQVGLSTNNTQQIVTDASGNVGIGTASPTYKLDVTGTGHITGVVTLDTALGVSSGGTGVTTSVGAVNALQGYTTTAKTAGTTTLTNTSTYTQFFTGASTHTVTMPNATTLTTGWSFRIVNLSAATLTARASGDIFIYTIPAYTVVTLTTVDTSSAAGNWWAIAEAFATGVVPVENGGTGATTLTGIVKGSGTSAFSAAVRGTDYSLLSANVAVSSTSGQVIDFNSIPSGVKRITVILSAVSTNGTSNLLVQIGDSGGVENTGYAGGSVNFTNGTLGMQNFGGAGFTVFDINAATAVHHAHFTLTNISGNIWVGSAIVTRSDTTRATVLSGTKTLSGTLDRVRVTTNNGTDSFDAGTINIFFEY